MRVFFCKIHFSFICFCKPSSHLYTSSPLKLENTPHASPLEPHHPPEQAFEAQSVSISNGNGGCNDHPSEHSLKSSLRKLPSESSVIERKKVQWADDLPGNQLVEIKEFESNEYEEIESQCANIRRCICTIL